MLPLMETTNAEEREALKRRAVAALRAALKAGTDPKALVKKCDIAPEALGRYLAGESYPTPTGARTILDALAVK